MWFRYQFKPNRTEITHFILSQTEQLNKPIYTGIYKKSNRKPNR
jgi:hypothetical protein